MINRISKLTAILMAAGVVVSIAPNKNANAAVQLETLNGTMNTMQAFSDGKYLFDGYKDASDDTDVYFFDGIKDKALSDVDGDYIKYSDKYLSFSDDDNSLVNLNDGSIDDSTIEDKIDNLQIKFKTRVINKADRYDDTKNLTYVDRLNKDNFGQAWFEYKLENNDASKSYVLFINEDGDYIDSSEKINIVHYLADGTKVEINDYDDLNDKGYNITYGNALFSDSNYIYRTATITNQSNLEDAQTYLQKISKAQGETVDGAYVPKEVKSYELGDILLDDITPNEEKGLKSIIHDNSLYTIKVTDNKLTMNKYDFIKERDGSSDAVTKDRVYKLSEDEDYDGIKDEKIYDYDIDVNNNVWILYKGKVQKVDGDKLETFYTVDRSMNNISVYDENDIVVWNGDEEIYSTVGGSTLKEGFTKYLDGTVSYLKADGSKVTGWVKDSEKWYYFNNEGVMQTGWLLDNGTWYYLQNDGSMATGWLKDGDTIYYLNESGAMQNGGWTLINNKWYYLNANGSVKTGWFLDRNLWYYLDESGAMVTNTVIDGYKIGPKGFWIK